MELHARIAHAVVEIFPHLVGIAGIDHNHPAVLEPVEDHVVVRAAAFVGENVVACLPRLHRRHCVDSQPVGPLRRALTLQYELRHVREVEESGGIAHRFVLFENARVLNGHVEPAERNQPRMQLHVLVVKGRAFHFFAGFSFGYEFK